MKKSAVVFCFFSGSYIFLSCDEYLLLEEREYIFWGKFVKQILG